MKKIPVDGNELTSQRVRGLRGTSKLPGRPAIERKKITVVTYDGGDLHILDVRTVK